jgi:hypothetical protein
MRKIFLFALFALLIMGCGKKAAAQVNRWDLHRASFGVAGAAVLYDPGWDSGPFGGVAWRPWLNYSLSRQLSAHVTVDGDFGRKLGIFRAGGHARLNANPSPDAILVFVGGGYVRYFGDGRAFYTPRENSWDAYVQAAKAVLRQSDGSAVFYAFASGSYDPNQDLKIARLGISWQLLGGNP